MCPNSKELSAFVDGELSSKKSENIKQHIDQCQTCTEQVKTFEKVTDFLYDDTVKPLASRKESIYNSILDRIEEKEQTEQKAHPPLWKWRVSVPFPALTTLVLLVFLLTFGMVYTLAERNNQGPDIRQAENTSPQDLSVTVKINTIEQLLDILNKQEYFREVTIELPEKPSFDLMGEPTFIKNADYSRRLSP